ncbi:MAG: DUF2892 domain-containing protein [Rhodobacteraceae bacterium]|nr:DUF2892 domain-containing protein [Paracoccaceae bacterium]
MTANVGTLDRVLRAALGLALLALAVFGGFPALDTALVKTGLIVVGIVMLVVAATRVCPVYSVFGFKTCRA